MICSEDDFVDIFALAVPKTMSGGTDSIIPLGECDHWNEKEHEDFDGEARIAEIEREIMDVDEVNYSVSLSLSRMLITSFWS